MAATTTIYMDPQGNNQTGYIIDDETYTDSAGENRVPVGSLVMAGGDIWEMTDDGGVLYGPETQQSTSGYPVENKYIDEIYEGQIDINRKALEAAYDQNVLQLDAAKERLPDIYYDARNQTAGQAEVRRSNFNEYAAASGLSSGAGAQATLAFGNQLQGNLSSLDKGQANAMADLELQLTQLTTQYQNDLALAFAQGNLDKVNALYSNYVTNEARIIEQSRFDAQQQQNEDALAAAQEDTAFNRARDAAILSGNYSGMAAFGWEQEWIDSAEEDWARR